MARFNLGGFGTAWCLESSSCVLFQHWLVVYNPHFSCPRETHQFFSPAGSVCACVCVSRTYIRTHKHLKTPMKKIMWQWHSLQKQRQIFLSVPITGGLWFYSGWLRGTLADRYSISLLFLDLGMQFSMELLSGDFNFFFNKADLISLFTAAA